MYGHKGANQYTVNSIFDENQAQKHASNQEKLTQQDKEYVQAHEINNFFIYKFITLAILSILFQIN